MNNIILKLDLNEIEGLIFKAENKVEDLFFCEDIEISLHADQEYRLTIDCLQYTFRSFITDLNYAIDGKLSLHSSIKYDLGYMWNEKCSGESSIDFYFENIESHKSWVGKRYILFSAPGKFNPRLTTWLYNNELGDITLEVTPSYRWHFDDPEPGENYISYADFIKNYKPILFRTIPKQVAQEWVEQAQNLLQAVESKKCD